MNHKTQFIFLKFLFINIFFFLSFQVESQTVKITDDLEGWGNISLKKNIGSTYTLKLDQEIRFNNSLSKYKNSASELSFSVKCNKRFNLGLTGRYKFIRDRENNISNRYRYGLFIRTQIFKNKKLKLLNTIKYQKEYNKSVEDYKSYWKFKLKSLYKITNTYKIFASSELFRVTELCRTPYFETSRSWIGISKKINKNDLSIALGYEKELLASFPKSLWLIKIKYSIEL